MTEKKIEWVRFDACPVVSPNEHYMCKKEAGHAGRHECDEWFEGEMTGRLHVWGLES